MLTRRFRPIAFHPTSVLFETPTHPELIEKVGVRMLIEDVIDELMSIASRQHCQFPNTFKQRVIQTMTQVTDNHSIMYQDFMSRRPMEVETYLGVPVKLAKELDLHVPRLQTLYALLHHLNHVNQTRPPGGAPPPGPGAYPPRLSSGPPPRPMMNGHGPRPGRPPSGQAPLPLPPGGPGMRRGPPPPMMNGHPPRGPPPMGNGYPPRGGSSAPPVRRISADASELEEFGHLMLYDNIPEGEVVDGPPMRGHPAGMVNGHNGSTSDLALRERELALRQREMALREQEFHMRRGGRRPPPPPSQAAGFDDDEDDDYFDPSPRGPPQQSIDPDSFDMMSVTSRRTRKAPSASQLRKNPESRTSGMGGGRSAMSRNRVSARMMQDIPGLHESLMNNPMIGFSSNRYGTVDRKVMSDESRTNSLTAARLEELQHAGGATPGMNGHHGPPPPHMMAKRTSQSPGNPYGPASGRPPPPHHPNGMNRPSPPGGANGGGYGPPPGPSPGYGGPPYGVAAAADGVRQPIPRYPAGQGNSVAPQQVEQRAGQGIGPTMTTTGGVSSQTLRPPIKMISTTMNTRSLTGSASASAASGSNNDASSGGSGSGSGSASASASASLGRTPVDSSTGNSAASSQSSLNRPSRLGMNGIIGKTTAAATVPGVR